MEIVTIAYGIVKDLNYSKWYVKNSLKMGLIAVTLTEVSYLQKGKKNY